MTLMRIRPKGQLTLPDSIRREVHLEEGDYLEVAVEEGTTQIRVGTALFGQRPRP